MCLMSKELCDSPLKVKKSGRSGVLLISVGQSIGPPVDINSSHFSCMVWHSSRPLVLIKRKSQYWRFNLKSPPNRSLCPSELMKAL